MLENIVLIFSVKEPHHARAHVSYEKESSFASANGILWF